MDLSEEEFEILQEKLSDTYGSLRKYSAGAGLTQVDLRRVRSGMVSPSIGSLLASLQIVRRIEDAVGQE